MTKQPFFVEFTGTPEAGKTTAINEIARTLERRYGFNVGIIHEAAEAGRVPSVITKGSFDFTRYTRLKTLSEIIYMRNSDYDIVLVDRGYYDGQLMAQIHYANGICTKEELQNFLGMFSDTTYAPDQLIVLYCNTAESLKRRGGPGHIVTEEFVSTYNAKLNYFVDQKIFNKVPYLFLDTGVFTPTTIRTIIVRDIIAKLVEHPNRSELILHRETVDYLGLFNCYKSALKNQHTDVAG